MPGFHRDEFFITGNYGLYVGKTSLTLTTPTDIAETLNTELIHVGFTHADGAKFTYNPTVTKYEATEAIGPVAARVTKVDATLEVKCEQWNKTTINAAYGGGTWTTTTTGNKWVPPVGGGAPAEYAVVLLPVDGASSMGIVLTNALAGTAQVVETFKRGDQAVLDLKFEVLADDAGNLGFYRLTGGAGFAMTTAAPKKASAKKAAAKKADADTVSDDAHGEAVKQDA